MMISIKFLARRPLDKQFENSKKIETDSLQGF